MNGWKMSSAEEFFYLLGCNAVYSVESQPPFRKRRLTFNGLLGAISQEIELLLTTAVRISNPKCYVPVTCTYMGVCILRFGSRRLKKNL
jgi:hypothetical protein